MERAQSQGMSLLCQPLQLLLVLLHIQEVEADGRSFGENLSRKQIGNQDPGRVAGSPGNTSNLSVQTFKTSIKFLNVPSYPHVNRLNETETILFLLEKFDLRLEVFCCYTEHQLCVHI